MTSKKLLVLGAAIALAFAYAAPAQAVLINFTIDTIGNGAGATPIAPSAGNIGKYAAGSYVALGGSLSGSLSGIGFSGTFGAQSGQAASGSFSTGNPGSLLAFYTGGLLADINDVTKTVSFPGGSAATGLNYTKAYPVQGKAVVPLIPAIGGGTKAAAGSDAANYGVATTIKALGFLTVTSGNAALRGTVLDVAQTVSGSSIPQTGAVGNQSFVVKGNINPTIATSTFDYNFPGGNVVVGNTIPDLIGTEAVTNISAPQSGSIAGNLTRSVVDASRQIYNFYITVPMTTTATQSITGSTPVTITVSTTGQLAAYALNVQVPEPATLALAGIAAVPLGLLAWKRRRTRA